MSYYDDAHAYLAEQEARIKLAVDLQDCLNVSGEIATISLSIVEWHRIIAALLSDVDK